jgi:hypothetical protein
MFHDFMEWDCGWCGVLHSLFLKGLMLGIVGCSWTVRVFDFCATLHDLATIGLNMMVERRKAKSAL